jgi:diaminopimelate epimerase
MNFVKMHGLGNDFIVVQAESFAEAVRFQPLSIAWCNRNYGIGADGILVTGFDSEEGIFMRIFNPDGSEAEMCGNGIRCIALWAQQAGLVDKDEFSVKTLAGARVVKIVSSKTQAVRVDMGPPGLNPLNIPMGEEGNLDIAISAAGQPFKITAVSMGNPHAIVVVEDVSQILLEKWGAALENAPLFPYGTNVEFVQILGKEELKVRVWERGAGVTQACGTGACASLVACHLLGKANRQARVYLPGGDLWIEWNAEDDHVYMTGTAVEVFRGIISEQNL